MQKVLLFLLAKAVWLEEMLRERTRGEKIFYSGLHLSISRVRRFHEPPYSDAEAGNRLNLRVVMRDRHSGIRIGGQVPGFRSSSKIVRLGVDERDDTLVADCHNGSIFRITPIPDDAARYWAETTHH